MTLETEINLYCPKCKKDFTRTLDTNELIKCVCGGLVYCTGFQVVDM